MKNFMDTSSTIILSAVILAGVVITVGGFLFFSSRRSKELEELTFRNLLKFANDRKPQDDNSIAHFSAIKNLLPNGNIKVTVVYLNEKKETVFTTAKGEKCGFTISAKRLDSELSNLFADKDIILFN